MGFEKRYFAILAIKVEIDRAKHFDDAKAIAEELAYGKGLQVWSVWSERQLPPEEMPPLPVK